MDPYSYLWMEHKPYVKFFPSTWLEEHYGIPFAENSDIWVCGYYLQCFCGRRRLKPSRDGHPVCPWCG
eukprot:11161562-Lingulodinium_polyedra.AAC.1